MASIKDEDCPKIKRIKLEYEENAQDVTPTEASSAWQNPTPTEASSAWQNPTPTEAWSVSQNPNNNTDSCPSYARNYLRLSKDNLYMILALWMEDLVDEKPEPYRKVGAVLALPNDVVVGADCSRDGVHAVARLLMKHYDKAEGSKMFVSRKPCPTCAKLLVQSKVNRLLYLPFEPEYYLSPRIASAKKGNKTLMKQVDNLFTASSIGQTKFVLQVEKVVLEHADQKTPKKEKSQELREKTEIQREENRLFSKYFPDESTWFDSVKEELPWPALDNDLKAEVQKYFKNAMNWIARATVLSGNGLEYVFRRSEDSKQPNANEFHPEVAVRGDPEVANSLHQKQARHFITMARFLAERSDDPKTGVGAVIVKYPSMDIIAFGWNGFPLKALYGEFARASKDDKTADDKKYPYVIHAEQNALLMRNTKNIEGSILFVTKTPCDECAPLIKMEGIKTVVVDEADSRDKKRKTKGAGSGQKGLGYQMFANMVKQGNFICYQTRKMTKSEAGGIRRQLDETF